MKKEKNKKELGEQISDKDKKSEEESELEELIEEPEQDETALAEQNDITPKGVPPDMQDGIIGGNIDENQFREFVQTESTAPVLEEITGEQELGGRVFFTPGMDAREEDENQTNYSLGEYKPNESKYDESPRSFHEEVSTGSALDVGLARNSGTRQQDFTFSTPEAQSMQRDVEHKPESDYLQAERFEQKNQEMPFEKEDRKYEKFKP